MHHYVASDLGLHCLPMTLFTGSLVRMGYTKLGLKLFSEWSKPCFLYTMANKINSDHKTFESGRLTYQQLVYNIKGH